MLYYNKLKIDMFILHYIYIYISKDNFLNTIRLVTSKKILLDLIILLTP